ncbi:MAG: hypothetical protein AB1437_17055 [Pseudomonadota bacterium]
MPTTNITVISVALARLYLAVLLEHLKAQLEQPEHARDITIRYGKLVERTRQAYPDAPHIEAAIATNVGTRLLVVQLICERLRLPNLACLAVNATGKPGIAYQNARDWDSDKAAVLSFDWSQVGADIANAFDIEAKEAAGRAVKPKSKAVPEDDARQALYDASRADPDAYKVDYYQREAMVKLIMKGLPIDEAYAEVSE